jgi:putative phosphoesterase
MYKIAIISDIHCNLYLFNEVLKDIANKGINEYIFLGDYITDGPNSNQILNTIRNLSDNVVAGNREKSIVEYDGMKWIDNIRYKNMLFTFDELSLPNKEYLKELPIYKVININGYMICFSHGTPFETKEEVLSNSFNIFDKLINDFNCDIYLFGHQHKPFYTEYRNKKFINPGSINTPNDGNPTTKYGIITIDDDIKYELVELSYNYEEVKNYYLESSYYLECQEWCKLLLYTLKKGIDHNLMFIAYTNHYISKEGKGPISAAMWHELFNKFVEEHSLEIIN